MSRAHRWWTPEEDEYIRSNWGRLSRPKMAKHLGRSPRGVKCRGYRLGLGTPNEAQDMIVVNNLYKAMGFKTHNIHKVFRGAHLQRVVTANQRTITMIRQEDAMEWLRTHQDSFDASLIEEYALGTEPDWLKEKRRADIREKHMGIRKKGARWSPEEIDEAIRLTKRGWSAEEIGELHGRTADAVHGVLWRNGYLKGKRRKEWAWMT